jgi:hypothetical protein
MLSFNYQREILLNAEDIILLFTKAEPRFHVLYKRTRIHMYSNQ